MLNLAPQAHPVFLSYSLHSITNRAIVRGSMYINLYFLFFLIVFHFPPSVYSSPWIDVALILVAA